LIVERQLPGSTTSGSIEDGASDIRAFASIPLNVAFRKLTTSTHTFIGLSKIILHHDVSVRSESGSFHS
jgi:hypothetical protein